MTSTVTVSGVDEFPNEQLEKIFGYINDNKKELRRVCKGWYNVVGGVTKFVLFEDSILDFTKDLQDYPNLQSKVMSLWLKKHRYSGPTTTSDDPADLFSTKFSPLCSNLAELNWMSVVPSLMCEHSTSNTAMINTQTLGRLCNDSMHITSVKTNNWEYVQSLQHFTSSLTHMDLQVDYFLLKVKDHGLCNFIAAFKCLKYLCLEYKSYVDSVRRWDVETDTNPLNSTAFPLLFFDDKTQGLETIKLFGKVELLYEARYLDVLIDDEKMNNILDTLIIVVECMDILCLQFITKKLNKIENLTIRINDVVSVHKSAMILNEEEVENIIEELRTYCIHIEGEVNVNFRLEGRQ